MVPRKKFNIEYTDEFGGEREGSGKESESEEPWPQESGYLPTKGIHFFIVMLLFLFFKKKSIWSKYMTLCQVQRALDSHLFVQYTGQGWNELLIRVLRAQWEACGSECEEWSFYSF